MTSRIPNGLYWTQSEIDQSGDFMNTNNWLAVACFIGFALIVLIPFWFIFSMGSKKVNEEIEKARLERESIRKAGGITAPAVIISARWEGERNKHLRKILFVVDVLPENLPPFRATFRDEAYRRNIKVENYEITSELGQKIWVTYDPSNSSRMFLERYEDESNSI